MPVPSGSQTVGPFFKFALDHESWHNLNEPRGGGESVRVTGTILDGDGAPVPDAFVEIRQADEGGTYRSDATFPGFGRASTDYEGVYRFVTAMPGAVPSAQAVQAPHLVMSIFARGLLKQLVTRMYFGDREEENAADPVLQSIEDPGVRRTMIARRADHTGITTYHFDIILQGEGETAFLEL